MGEEELNRVPWSAVGEAQEGAQRPGGGGCSEGK
jgi:hypothetical protein